MVYFVDKTFTNGKGRGYNVQNLLKKNGIDFEHFAFMGFVFWITRTQQGIARKQSALTHGRSRNGKQRWRKLQHTAAVPEPTSTIRRRIRPTLKHITAPPGRRSGRTRKKNLDVLVCVAGTGGTGFGTACYLREQNPALKVVLVQPHPDSRLTAEHPDFPIIDGVLPVYGVPESEQSDYLRPEGLFLFIHHNIR